MDIELVRTFLVVISSGSFVSAAKRLHVTQSTVSARIQRLEADLGAELFVRNKSGTTLTPAGKRFQHHASRLTRTVEQARQEIGVTSGFRAALTVGGRIGLWEDLLLRWLPTYASLAPDIAVRALIGFEEELMQALTDGRADIAVMYTPQARPGLTIEPLFEDRLVMVSTKVERGARLDGSYVYVDWGPEFFAHHSLAFPDYQGTALTVNVGWLGLQHVLASGGSGHFSAPPGARARAGWSSASRRRGARVPPARLPLLRPRSGQRCAGARPRHDQESRCARLGRGGLISFQSMNPI